MDEDSLGDNAEGDLTRPPGNVSAMISGWVGIVVSLSRSMYVSYGCKNCPVAKGFLICVTTTVGIYVSLLPSQYEKTLGKTSLLHSMKLKCKT